jgi:hypothetical protein
MERFLGTWTDVVAGLAALSAVIYLGFEINRRQKKLRELFHVLGPDSALMTETLEELVRRGVLQPEGRSAAT